MDVFEKINKGVGLAATAIIISGASPQIAQAMTNIENPPKLQAKAICKDIEKSIKNGTYEIDKLKADAYPNVNGVSKKDKEVLSEKKVIKESNKNEKDKSKDKKVNNKVSESKTSKQETKQEEKTKAKVKSEVKTVGIKVLKAENDEPSMSGGYIEKEVKYIKENGKMYCEVKLLATDWMQNIKIEVDGKEIKHTLKETGDTNVMGMDHKGGIIRFEVTKMNPKITFHMYVEPMKHDVTFRIVGDNEGGKPTKPVEPQVKPQENQNNVKPQKPSSKPEEKPSTKPEEKPSVKPQVKPSEKPAVEEKKSEVKTVGIKVLKAENDEPSMSGGYIEKEVKYIKENGKMYCEVKLLATDWMQNIKVEVDGAEVKHTLKETGNTNVMGMDHKGGIIRFEVSKMNPKITFHMYVEPMKHDVTFRIVGENEDGKPTKPVEPQVKPQENQNNVKPQKPSNKPEEKPSTKPEEKPSVKPQVKPSEKPAVEEKKSEEKTVGIKVLKAENDEPSMSGGYIEKEVKYIKENGKIYCEVKLLAVDWMQNIKIEVDGKEIKHTLKETGDTNVMGMDHKGGIIRFEVTKVNPKITFHMYVEPMKHDVTFRIVGENQSEKPTKPVEPQVKSVVIDVKKPGVYKVQSKIQVKDAEEEKVIKKHLDLDENENLKFKVNVEGGKIYIELKIKGKSSSISDIIVNGKKITLTNIKENAEKKNTFASKDMLISKNNKNDEENFSIIKFEVPDVNADINIKVHDDELKKDVGVELKLDNVKEVNDEVKPQVNPNTTGNKPSNHESNKDKTTSKDKKEATKQIKVKVLKSDSNDPSMAAQYIEKNITYTEKDGKKYFKATLNRIDWMKNIDISVDGKSVTYTKKESGNTADLTFEVNSENSEVIFHTNVVPMGNSRVTFRLVNADSSDSNHSSKSSTSKNTTKKDKEKKKDKRKDELKIDANKHGMYRVDVDVLKSDSDDRSMAGQYLNSSCKYEVKGDKKYFTLTFNRMDWMKNIEVYVNDDKKDYDTKSIGKNRSELKFETDGIGAVIEVKMNVVPMGNSRVTFRILPKKSSLELLDEYKDDSSKNDNSKNDNKTSENDSKNQSKDNVKDDSNNKKDTSENNNKEVTDSKKTSEKNNDVTDANKEKQGLYEVSIKALKENSNEPSMAGTYLGNKINIQLKNGKTYAIVKLNRSDWMKNINILVNDKDKKYEIINVKSLDNGEKSTTLKFEIPDLNSDIKFKMNVEPMGNSRVTFRVKIQKDTLKFLEGNEYDPAKAEKYLNDLSNKTNKNIANENKQSIENTEKTSNPQEIKEKKLPRTGWPFGAGAISAIGSVLSGLGITLMKKNKKRGE